ncbi:hypothetical protein [Spirosoma sordidisoli]|uniref:Uncharacterized protein n=1 Tax=Spirosoma sordidisoli TaxID=2502893 RepID=A0A4Q2UBN5_9BACT|nr:hypothetical protein [Spirosoma sordidisoli]RYC66357.1 hypothetical protein EQG79_30250 [Spirosoma sordidisoli]
MVTTFTSQSLQDYPLSPYQHRVVGELRVLKQYLREVHHTDLLELAQTDSIELVKDCFHQFVVFLSGTAPLAVWYDDFKTYANELLAWLARPAWHTDWAVMSPEFLDYARAINAD